VAVPARPHLLGIDDGPFEKGRDRETPLVAVMMEGHDLVEGVAIERFPVDGDDVTGFLAAWIAGLRFRPAVQGMVLGGLTIAGLAVVDVARLARETSLPVLAVNRRDPSRHRVGDALRAAGLPERMEILERAPESVRVDDGLYAAFAGADRVTALSLLAASRHKSALPEPLRVAHLVAAALARGASRGRA